MPSIEVVLQEYFNNMKLYMKNNPLNLGGISYSGGGIGGPPGGFIGQLPQSRVAYDYQEDATPLEYIPSGVSILDNLNHIRYRINMISGYGAPDLMILQSGSLVVSGFKYLNFEGDVNIEPYLDGVTVTMISIPGEKGDTGASGIDGVGVTDITISLSGVQIASGVKNINFEGNVQVVSVPDGVTVTMSGGGSSLSLPFQENVGIYTNPSGALHTKASGINQVPLIIESSEDEIITVPGMESLWVAGTSSTTYPLTMYSTDMENWSKGNATLGGSGGGVHSIKSNGSYWLLASEYATEQLFKSTDGKNWTALANVPFPGGHIKCICWNGSMWVAGGYADSGATWYVLAYSTDDCETWTAVYQDLMDDECNDIAWNGSKFVAVGSAYTETSVIIYSSDGINWSSGATDTLFSYYGTSICWGNNMWIAGGRGINSLAYSSDGTSWTGLGLVFSAYCNQIAWNGTKFIAVGSSVQNTGKKTCYYSTDGTNWTGFDVFVLHTGAYSNEVICVGWNGSYWIVGGADYNVSSTAYFNAYSSDGTNWTKIFYQPDDGNYLTFDGIGSVPTPQLIPAIPAGGGSQTNTQAANLTEWRNSSGEVISYVGKDGDGTFTNLNIKAESGITISGINQVFTILDSGGGTVHQLIFSGGLLVDYS